ncbi:ATP-binding cassette domain-containing protein, partial [Escherichia coli]|nr:ATP-binding cassette domain-containing protein [Escherichia coli]
MTTTAILDVADLHGYYGKSHVLQGVALSVGEGELVTLLGRNGAGKSTTLKTIAGVVTPRGGQVRFRGRDIAGQPPHRIAAQ